MKTRLIAAALALGFAVPAYAQDSILNVSYDVARELFQQINPEFAKEWKEKTGRDVTIDQSHAGSSAQARAILEGLPADVVTFNQVTDIDVLAKGGLVDENWREEFPNQASPYYSLPSFLVRKGNPKGIKDWDDLVRDDVQVIFPNPKTSGNARYTYLAAYAYALDKFAGDQSQAQDFVKKLFANVPVFDTGGRGATTTFAEKNIGDVLITFEAETGGIAKQYPDLGFERVAPSLSLLSEFPVAVVEENAKKKGTEEVSKAYLNFLYAPEGQKILAQNFYRVNDETVKAEFAADFPEVKLVSVEDVFGGWDQVRAEHFAEGGILDKLLVNQ
ncbi:sulfate ABC transporter substrate-binding protein [Sinirhodobacter populi]|uniref:Sulfate ABC transporter substrate-binding protein n=1 Tax=Paenirhodobacter populi TaxID=2306993 RepID=A0A443KC87_9RHOB|nr:sulfate ABC transporter substrate-binding protein [Sinirhodobacter populi]RWR30282.1 sulfate ABC transporter substrate-binding protein [Sinirhodobacter populi]